MGIFDKAREKLFAKTNGEELPLESADDQSPEDKALVAFVRSQLEDRRQSSARVAQEGINLTNIAYLCGFDSVYFDGTSRQFRPIASPTQFLKRNRVHVNRILPTVQNRLARLLKNPPRYDVRPKSGDEEDKDGARLAEQVILDLWERTYVNRKRIELTMWLQQCGIAYFKVSWDETLGEKKIVPNLETGEMEYVSEGDIRVDVCSFFEIFPENFAKNWEENNSIVQAKIRKLNYFKDHYPERGHLVKQEDCWLNSLTYESRINSLNTISGTAGGSANQLKDSAIEISYYEKPSKRHPKGRHLITANGVLLKPGGLPIDELPFIKFDDVIVGGKYNSEAIITHLRPLQDQINRGKQMRAAWSNRLLTGKIMAPRGSNLAAESMNDQSGEVFYFDPLPNGGEPKAFEMPNIPQYAYQEEDTLKLDMDDTAGINQATRGQMPSSSIPAIGMQLLVEQDDTRIGVETESHEYSYADLGRILLKFVDEYYETPRLLKTVGENMEYTVQKYVGTDIRKNFDCHVIRGSTLPGSKVLKRQEIMNLRDQGYFGNPQDPLVIQNVLSMLEYGDEYQGWKSTALRKSQINRGIKMVELYSEKPPVSEFDDHALWMQELNDYRISEKFEKMSPDQKMIILELINEHEQWIRDLTGLGQGDPSNDPNLKETNAAQGAEEEAKAMAMGSGQENLSTGNAPMHAMPEDAPQPEITPPPEAGIPPQG